MVWLASVFLVSGVAPSKAPLITLLMGALPLLLAYRYAQALATVSMPERTADLNYFADLSKSLWYRTAEARHRAEAEQREELERVQDINSSDRRGWKCSACGADNPSTFDICWTCEKQTSVR
jgi:hypothetical protein